MMTPTPVSTPLRLSEAMRLGAMAIADWIASIEPAPATPEVSVTPALTEVR